MDWHVWFVLYVTISIAAFFATLFIHLVIDGDSLTLGELVAIMFGCSIPVINVLILAYYFTSIFDQIYNWIFNTFCRLNNIVIWKGRNR